MKKTWLRPLPFALALGLGATLVGRTRLDDTGPNRSALLCSALGQTRGITCQAGDVLWLEGPPGVVGAMFGSVKALVRARDRAVADEGDGTSPDPESLDVFIVGARLSPEGHVLELGDAHNLTKSSGADELLPIAKGSLVAYVVEVDGHPQAVHLIDLHGHAAHAYDELTSFERTQVKIADYQSTGLRHGLKKTVFTLVPPPKKVALAFRDDGRLELKAFHGDDGGDVRVTTIEPRTATADNAADIRISPEVIAKPPTFGPWMSDRLRAISWFGDEKNQVLKAVVFTALEWVKNKRAAITGDTGEEALQDDFGGRAAPSNKAQTFTDPESGWPPKRLEPMIKPALTGEGEWIRLDDDPFILPMPGLPSPFVTTFVRTDPSAVQTRVYVTVWDPRLVALHMVAGTVEPVSATGEAGPGKIPRAPETLRRVIGGFNGGFQATHGEFGMQAAGILYLPPKPYAATVLDMRDGTTAFAAWPKEATVPEDVLSFRQNMTFMVQNDKYNPWGRAWWGGVPPGWHDAIHTTRSGLCLTKEHFVAYLFGHDIGPEPLGRAMLAARCQVGMHLDMNPGLAGFEFYNVQPAETWKPLGRPLQNDWEHEGTIKDAPELKFRSRRMVRSMGHILFPRYIGRDGRDFFYLTARNLLPGAPLEPGAEWRVKGLPQHGYPYATAITTAKLSATSERRARVLRIDPRAIDIDSDGSGEEQTVVVFGNAARARDARPAASASAAASHESASASRADAKLWMSGHAFGIDRAPPDDKSVVIANVLTPTVSMGALARTAVGVSDDDGMLVWVELFPDEQPSAETSEAMLGILKRAGCSARGLVSGDLRAFLGGTMDVGAEPAAPANVTVRFTRRAPIGATQMFESTAVVPQSVWQPLQAQRVKWRPTLAPPDKPAASASASGSAAPPPAPASSRH